MKSQYGIITPREYQADANDCVFHAYDMGIRRALVQLPTGTGKTVLMGLAAHEAIERRWPVLMLAHRQELLGQAGEDFAKMGLETVLEMGSSRAQMDMGLFGTIGTMATVVLGSIATMKGNRLATWPQERFGLILVDETHHIVAPQYKALLAYFKNYRLLGVTATADRADKKNIGQVFNETDRPVYEFPLKAAIELGYLVPIEVIRLFTGIDLNDVKKTTQGDLNLDDLAEKISPEINGLCKHIVREVGQRKTIIFAPNVRTSEGFASCLSSGGRSSMSVSSKDSDEYRKNAIKDFKNGHIQFLCNYGIFTEGFNEPSIEAVVSARPTTSRALYSQMVGRGTRPWPGKTNCLLLDLVMNSEKHELVHPVELFDNSEFDDEVEAMARRMIDSGKVRDLVQAVNIADHQHRENKRLRVQSRETHFKEYKRVVYDPMGLCDVGLLTYRRSDFEGEWRATDSQIQKLKKFKIQNPETLTRTGAQRRIELLGERSRKGLATNSQLQHLVANGVPEEKARIMTIAEASEQLSFIFGKKK